ncbi:MAG: sigma-70 family RNA polymerase sigma factor [Nitrospirota bacterium]
MNDDADIITFLKENIGLVKKIAKLYTRRARYLDMDDFLNESFIAFSKARDYYNLNCYEINYREKRGLLKYKVRKVKFTDIFYWYLHKSFSEITKKEDNIYACVSLDDDRLNLRAKIGSFGIRSNGANYNTLILLSAQQRRTVCRLWGICGYVVESPDRVAESEGLTVEEVIEIEKKALKLINGDFIEELIKPLPLRSQNILRLLYSFSFDYHRVAEVYGLTVTRIRQIEKEAIEFLRGYFL